MRAGLASHLVVGRDEIAQAAAVCDSGGHTHRQGGGTADGAGRGPGKTGDPENRNEFEQEGAERAEDQ